MFQINNTLSDFIAIKTDLSDQNILSLIDTEASVSIIKVNSIPNLIKYDNSERIKLRGITEEPIYSLGSCFITLLLGDSEVKHKFHVVSEKFPIPSHALIGKEFLKAKKCIIDYESMNLTIRVNNTTISIPIKSELLRGLSALPPRSESFKIFHIKQQLFTIQLRG